MKAVAKAGRKWFLPLIYKLERLKARSMKTFKRPILNVSCSAVATVAILVTVSLGVVMLGVCLAYPAALSSFDGNLFRVEEIVIEEISNSSKLYPTTSVIISGVGRNIAKYLRRLLPNIFKVCHNFSHFLVIFFENGSSDGSSRLLQAFVEKHENTVLLTGDFVASDRREVRLAQARNTVLKYIRSLNESYDYWINLDMDDVLSFAPIDPGMFRSALGRRDSWDVVCANTWPAWYYDRLALRTRIGPFKSEGCNEGEACHENRPVDLSGWLGKDLQGSRGIPSNHEKWIPVDSCFGGLAMYRMSSLTGAKNTSHCYYDGAADCEHVAFHECLRRDGGARLFIDPSMVPFELAEEEVPHSIAWCQRQ